MKVTENSQPFSNSKFQIQPKNFENDRLYQRHNLEAPKHPKFAGNKVQNFPLCYLRHQTSVLDRILVYGSLVAKILHRLFLKI
jgi:hypothetical protein